MHATAEKFDNGHEFELPGLPYAMDALEPHISKETLEYHYGKHHRGYVKKLNKAVADSEYVHMSLEEIIQSATGSVFNNAAQVWNHDFYWHSLSPEGGGTPDDALTGILEKAFGSVGNFRQKFKDSALANFGSGWTWLVKTREGGLDIMNTDDADTPLRQGLTPLLTCDVWEHAYYIDYRNERQRYLEAFFDVINWDFLARNLKSDP